MENKHSFSVAEILLAVTLVVGVVLIIAWVTVPLFRVDRIDLYLRVFLLLFAVLVLGVLRLYNAVVANTRYNIALVKVLTTLHKMLPGIHSTMQKQVLTTNSNTTRIKALSESIESAREVLDEITKKTKK